MTYQTFIEGLRLVDALMASLVFCLLVNRGRLYWAAYDTAQRWMYASFTLYVLAVAYASFELYAQNLSPGLRSYVVLFANFAALYALWKYRASIVLGQPDKEHPTDPR